MYWFNKSSLKNQKNNQYRDDMRGAVVIGTK